MKLNATAQSLLATTVLTGVLAATAEALPPPTIAPSVGVPSVRPMAPVPAPISQPSAVTFNCAQAGNGYATVVSKGTQQATLITWNSTSFGSEFSPQTRCNIVSQKFQTMVNRNGGRLSNLVLTIGSIEKQTVVCAINQGQNGCNRENMLFTLNSENAKNPGAVLTNLLQVGKYGSGNVVHETSELPEFNLEDVVNQKLSNSLQVNPTEQPSAVPATSPGEAPVPSGNSGSVF